MQGQWQKIGADVSLETLRRDKKIPCNENYEHWFKILNMLIPHKIPPRNQKHGSIKHYMTQNAIQTIL